MTNEIIFYNKKRRVIITLDIEHENEIEFMLNDLFYKHYTKQKGYAYRNDKIIQMDEPSYAEIWQTDNDCMTFKCRRYFRFKQLTQFISTEQINDPYIRLQQIAPKPMINWDKVNSDSFFGRNKRDVTIKEFYNKYKK